MGVIFALFVLYAVTLLYPMIWMFLSSLKGSLEYETGNSLDLPKRWLFSNYGLAFESLVVRNKGGGTTSFFGMVWNSVWMNGISIVLGTLVSAITTYTVAKLQFPGKKVFYAVILFMMMLPIYGSMASSLQIKKQLGVFDNVFNVLVSTFAVGGYKFLILYAFFKSVSWSYAEAAYIDGANKFQRILHVTLPALVPIITVQFIMRVGHIMSLGYEKIILLYNERVYETADVISTYVYKRGIENTNYSFSAAVGLFNNVINIVLLLCANAVSHRLSQTSLF